MTEVQEYVDREMVLDLTINQSVTRHWYYTGDEPLSEVSSISFSDLSYQQSFFGANEEVLFLECCSGSDYAGSAVSKANYNSFLKEFDELPQVHEVYGDYSSYGIAIELNAVTKKMYDFLAALDNYPVADDMELSRVEVELEMETWDACYEREFEILIVKQVEESLNLNGESVEIKEVEESALYVLFRQLCDTTNTDWEHGSGTECWIDLSRTMEDFSVYHDLILNTGLRLIIDGKKLQLHE